MKSVSLVKFGTSTARRGFSLVELLIAVALFTLLAGGVTFAAIDSVRNVRTLESRIMAEGHLNEVLDALLSIKNESWSSIYSNADGSIKGIIFEANQFLIVDGEQDIDGYTVYFVINPVQRDSEGHIVEAGGVADFHTMRITANVGWSDVLGVTREVSKNLFVNDWNAKRWKQTTVEDFTAGTHNLTQVTNNEGGEVVLENVVYADWCKPSLSMSSYDLPGQGVVQTIVAGEGAVHMGAGLNASGITYVKTLIDEEDPPNVVVQGQYVGGKTNDIFGESGYAYIATDTNAEEVIILDVSTVPYRKVGYVDTPGPTDAVSVIVDNKIGYVATNNLIYAFDLAEKTGSRPLIGSGLAMDGAVRNMKIRENYLFAAVSSVRTQVQIVDISIPDRKSIVGGISVDGAGGVDVAFNQEFDRAYVATETSSTKAEVFVVDISSKSGTLTALSSYDTNGMSPKSITRVSAPRVIVVGTGGEEYQVINIEDESGILRCGGMEIAAGINDVATYVNGLGTAYSYIVTRDSSDEFKIIKGGLGGGGDDGQGYAMLGEFRSQSFDSGSTNTQYYSIDVFGVETENTEIRIQVRATETVEAGDEPFIGPDGTSNTYFVLGGIQQMPSIVSNNRYLQFKVYMHSDTEHTPILEEVIVVYED